MIIIQLITILFQILDAMSLNHGTKDLVHLRDYNVHICIKVQNDPTSSTFSAKWSSPL